MKKITLCGSTKFKDAFLEFNKTLTLQGSIVYSVAFFGHADNIELSRDEKGLLDEIHFAKIDNSDQIFVLDVDGYIGQSTANEINHAKRTGKEVRYLSIEHPDWSRIYSSHFPECRDNGKCKGICALCYDLI